MPPELDAAVSMAQSALIVIFGALGVFLNLRNARALRNSKRGVRLFAAAVLLAVTTVYLLQLSGVYRHGLPFQLGRPLNLLLTASVLAYTLIET